MREPIEYFLKIREKWVKYKDELSEM